MRRLIKLLPVLALASSIGVAGAAHAEKVCTGQGADPAVSVALHLTDDGMVEGGEVHWAVPNPRPDMPSMVHIVYPLAGDRADSRPLSIITLNAVTGDDIVRSSTASIQIVVDGMEEAVRAWDLYGQAVARLQQEPPSEGISKASFLGAVPFTRTYEDGKRDTDSIAALMHIGNGAHTLEVRLLGQDGVVLQAHTYHLFDMPTPPPAEVKAALAASQKMAQDNSPQCQSY